MSEPPNTVVVDLTEWRTARHTAQVHARVAHLRGLVRQHRPERYPDLDPTLRPAPQLPEINAVVIPMPGCEVLYATQEPQRTKRRGEHGRRHAKPPRGHTGPMIG